MMRGVDHWSLAVRRPDETIGVHDWPARQLDEALPRPQAAHRARGRRSRRVARHRRPRPHALGQRVARRRGAAARQEGDRPSRWSIAFAFAVGLFFLAPLFLTGLFKEWLGTGVVFWIVEGVVRVAHLPRLPGDRHADQGPAPRLRVSRRRAHEHPRPRARRRAHRRPTWQQYKTLHLRCGTSFLLIVMVVSHLRLRRGATGRRGTGSSSAASCSCRSSPASATRSSSSPGVTTTTSPGARHHGARPRAPVDDDQEARRRARSRSPSRHSTRSSSSSRRTARRSRAWRSWREPRSSRGSARGQRAWRRASGVAPSGIIEPFLCRSEACRACHRQSHRRDRTLLRGAQRAQLTDPERARRPARYADVGAPHAELQAVHELTQALSARRSGRSPTPKASSATTARDAEMREFAQEELGEAPHALDELSEEIRVRMLTRDPNDAKDVIIEIRAGTGGDEASPVRRRPGAHVHALRAGQGLRGRDPQRQRERQRRLQGSDARGARAGRLLGAQVRERRAPRAARARPPRRRAASTPRRRRWPCCPRPRTSRSTSTPTTCASTSSGRAGRAGRA